MDNQINNQIHNQIQLQRCYYNCDFPHREILLKKLAELTAYEKDHITGYSKEELKTHAFLYDEYKLLHDIYNKCRDDCRISNNSGGRTRSTIRRRNKSKTKRRQTRSTRRRKTRHCSTRRTRKQ